MSDLEKAIEAVAFALEAQNQISEEDAIVLLDAARRFAKMSDLQKAISEWEEAGSSTFFEEVFVDAARRFASLTSPETIEKVATIIAMQAGFRWPDLKEPYREGFRRRAEAVLRSVEEGET